MTRKAKPRASLIHTQQRGLGRRIEATVSLRISLALPTIDTTGSERDKDSNRLLPALRSSKRCYLYASLYPYTGDKGSVYEVLRGSG